MNNAQLTKALAALVTRVELMEKFIEQVSAEVLAEQVNTTGAADLLSTQSQDDAPKPLEVGDRVRVLSGDWGNSFGVIKDIWSDDAGNHVEVDLEAHLQDAMIDLELLERA